MPRFSVIVPAYRVQAYLHAPRSCGRRSGPRFCPYDDGHAAERVVRRVFLDDTTVQVPAMSAVSLAEGRPGPAPVPESVPVPALLSGTSPGRGPSTGPDRPAT